MKTITIRLPAPLKDGLDESLKRMGISQTELFINISKYIVQHNRMPFEVIQQISSPADIRKTIYDKLQGSTEELDLLYNNIFNKKFAVCTMDFNRVINTIQNFYVTSQEMVVGLKHVWTDSEYETLMSTLNTAALIDVQLQRNILNRQITLQGDLRAFMELGLKEFKTTIAVLDQINEYRQKANDFGIPLSKLVTINPNDSSAAAISISPKNESSD